MFVWLVQFFEYLCSLDLAKAASVDVFVTTSGSNQVFWPVSPAGKEACAAKLGEFPCRAGGYMLPLRNARLHYYLLREAGCSRIARNGCDGFAIDPS